MESHKQPGSLLMKAGDRTRSSAPSLGAGLHPSILFGDAGAGDSRIIYHRIKR